MTAMTVTVPTLVLVLPLFVAVAVLHVWSWRRWVAPWMERRIYRRSFQQLVKYAGCTPERAAELIAEWKQEANDA